jgi:hypothetical protein
MRPLVSRGLLLPPLLCSALLLVPVGAAAAASGIGKEAADRTALAGSAPAADTVVKRLDALERADRADVFTPMAEAVNSIAVSQRGRLDRAEAAAYKNTVRAAHTAVERRLASAAPKAAAADPVSDLLAAIDAAVDELLKALTSLDLDAFVDAVTAELLTPVIELATSLGEVPEVPEVPEAPDLSEVLELSETPEVILPAAARQAG